jgi:2-iminobutanoate/2-iminopropanoate deaminase
MAMQVIATNSAPKAIGPYSQAIATEEYVFTAGQIPLDPVSMELVAGPIAEQTDRVFRNLNAVLEAAGTDLRHVVKATVYLIDMADFAAMNEVYTRHFGDHKPARSTVAVAGLPKGARVEIDVVAVRP